MIAAIDVRKHPIKKAASPFLLIQPRISLSGIV